MCNRLDTIPACDGQTDIVRAMRTRRAVKSQVQVNHNIILRHIRVIINICGLLWKPVITLVQTDKVGIRYCENWALATERHIC